MIYNKRLNCIDSWAFYGATSTDFLKLDGDKLKEFARVSTGEELVAEVFDKDENSHVLSRKRMREKDIYIRYMDFDPIVPYR
jgi:hypothetical protein